jgi:hypothetical protein
MPGGRDISGATSRPACLPFHDRVFGTPTDPAIVMALQDLADRVQVLMPVGAFPPVEVALVTAAGIPARLRFLPLVGRLDGDRAVEVQAVTPSGLSTSTRFLTRASNEQILATLRRSDTAEQVAAIIPELVEALQRHRLCRSDP